MNYSDARWKALGRWVRSARRRAGFVETDEWAKAVGRSTRVVLGLERGEPQGIKTLEGVAAALQIPTAQLLDVLEDGPGLDRDPGVAQHSDATLTDLAALPGEVAALRDRVAALEARLDDLSLHPGPFDAGVTYLPDEAHVHWWVRGRRTEKDRQALRKIATIDDVAAAFDEACDLMTEDWERNVRRWEDGS